MVVASTLLHIYVTAAHSLYLKQQAPFLLGSLRTKGSRLERSQDYPDCA
jgi:hypothetical protein